MVVDWWTGGSGREMVVVTVGAVLVAVAAAAALSGVLRNKDLSGGHVAFATRARGASFQE